MPLTQNFLNYFCFLCVMGILSAGFSVHGVHALCLWKPEESIGCSGTGVTGGCELGSCGSWELSPGLLGEQP